MFNAGKTLQATTWIAANVALKSKTKTKNQEYRIEYSALDSGF